MKNEIGSFMENKSEQKPSLLSEEETKGWNFYLSVGVMGADELRKELGLDELNFRRLAPNLNREPKKYFLYRILDEIQKAPLRSLTGRNIFRRKNQTNYRELITKPSSTTSSSELANLLKCLLMPFSFRRPMIKLITAITSSCTN